MKKTTLFTLFLVGITTVIFSACTQRGVSSTPAAEPTAVQTQQLTPTEAQPTTIEVTATQDGQTALELLETVATVQTKTYDFGTFVDGVNGLVGTSDNYWAFYVNNKYAQEGAAATILKTGDTIKFVYEPVTTSLMIEDSPVPGAGLEL